ncbi:MAG: hypothetical protein D6752_07400 [Candidatus Nitrosothermus koennekii]|nr:MAG: hypothetical protein D6752_07400 [Candidatus Nitrosothermus koennekii]
MDYDQLCKYIIKMDPKVRFAVICDESGEIIYGGHRDNIDSLLTEEESKRSLQQAWARWKLRNELASKIGRGKYAMAEYEKIKRITIPLDDMHLLLVTTDVTADHMRIINEILSLKDRLSTFK